MANPYKKAEQRPKVAPGSRPTAPVEQPAESKVEEVKQEVVVPEVVKPVELKKEEVVVAPVEQPVAPKVEEKQEVVAPVKEEKPVEPVKENVIIETDLKKNLLAGMIEQKPKGKSNSFYLDDEVVAALEKLAKQNKSSKSKVLNTLLRNLLIDEK